MSHLVRSPDGRCRGWRPALSSTPDRDPGRLANGFRRFIQKIKQKSDRVDLWLYVPGCNISMLNARSATPLGRPSFVQRSSTRPYRREPFSAPPKPAEALIEKRGNAHETEDHHGHACCARDRGAASGAPGAERALRVSQLARSPARGAATASAVGRTRADLADGDRRRDDAAARAGVQQHDEVLHGRGRHRREPDHGLGHRRPRQQRGLRGNRRYADRRRGHDRQRPPGRHPDGGQAPQRGGDPHGPRCDDDVRGAGDPRRALGGGHGRADGAVQQRGRRELAKETQLGDR